MCAGCPGHAASVLARADVLAAPWIAKAVFAVSKATRWSSTCRTSTGTKAKPRSGSSRTWRRLAAAAWVAYIGDDITDEDAFRAIPMGIGVLVGLRPTAATHKLNGIAEVDRFLRWLAAKE